MEDPVEETMEELSISQSEYDSSSNVIYASAVPADLHFSLD